MGARLIWWPIAVLLFAVACGGGNESERTPTPYHLIGTPDASGVIRAPVPALVAAHAGRTDCPTSWVLYEEEAYSICYPPDHYAEAWSMASSSQMFTVRLISGAPVAFTPNTVTLWTSATYNPPSDCYFEGEETAVPDKRQAGTFGLGHTTAEGCLAKLGGTTQYSGVIRTAGGQVQYRSQAATEDQFSLAKQILATLVVSDLCARYPKCATTQAELRITPTPTSTPLIPGPDVRLCRGSDIATQVHDGAYSGGAIITYIYEMSPASMPDQSSTRRSISRCRRPCTCH